MKTQLIKFIIGKNTASLARAAATFVGSLLLASALFNGEGVALDPSIGGDAAVQANAPDAAAVKDGLTLGELASGTAGLILIWGSRFVSWLRARNLGWAARGVGFLIGRSVPSLIRAMLTAFAGGLAYLTGNPAEAPEVVAEHPVASVFAAMISFGMARWMSATEDAERNPVNGSGATYLRSY